MPTRGRSVTAIILRMAKRNAFVSLGTRCENISTRVTRWTGSTQSFFLAVLVIIVWAAVGPIFGYSDTWQLVINTGTTIVTFLMVFLIQRAQNKDSLAIHLKLNEIVAAMEGSSNRLIDVEALNEKELATLHRYYTELAALARKEIDVTVSHSVEEARERHSAKIGAPRPAAKGK
jgi:low affinity Fe/Cu permease